MNNRRLHVWMDGIFIGILQMSATGALSFEYDSEYAANPDATPLSLSMPLQGRNFGNRVVSAFLQGLLPDNPNALESMARKYQVSKDSPFAMLRHVGRDVAGALQIIGPEEQSDDANADRAMVTALDDAALTQELHNVINTYDNGALFQGVQRMSLAGTQAKLGVSQTKDGGWALPSHGVPTTHIFKPQRVGQTSFPESDIVELFCQRVVSAAGIPAASTTLWNSEDGSLRAIVSERYDRLRMPDGTFRRTHQEDLCQALSVQPAKKYQRDEGGPGIGQIGRLLTTKISPIDNGIATRQFLVALTANAALLNTDAHAKNYSLMLAGPSVKLAPMYDVLSFGAFLQDGVHPLFPMKLGKGFDLEQVFPKTMVGEAARLRIGKDEAETIISKTLTGIDMALDHTAEEMAQFDYDGIITRTVEAIREHSALLKSCREA